MAAYSFAPRNGLGYSGMGLGQALVGGLNTGLDLANRFRDLENRNITDQFRVPAQASAYDAMTAQNANAALEAMALGSELTGLAGQPTLPDASLVPSYTLQQALTTGGPAAATVTNQIPPSGAYPLGPYFLPQ